jgi:predicted exporter
VRRALAAAAGPEAEIVSPSAWLAGGGPLDERLRQLRALPLERAADDLERELVVAGFRPAAFTTGLAALRALSRGEDPGAPPPGDWPDWLAELVRPSPPGGEAAVAVHVRLPLGAAAEQRREALAYAVREVSPDLALASIPRVGAELRELAVSDLRRSSGIAFLLVAVVVLGSFRGDPRRSLLASLPLLLGCLWTFGLWGAWDRPIDLLCISALPVLFGTGIDLGVHALHGERQHSDGIAGAVEEAGLPMTLTMLTTGVGFGALGASRIPGLQNAGLIVALGVTLCLAATFLVLPAIEALGRRP